jgi:peptidyl-tRNA hydrolase
VAPDLKKIPSRIKIPNFTAIHQQNFKKMESIAEHIARKAERTKQILAASKSPMNSAKKEGSSKVIVKIPTKCNLTAVPAKSAEPMKAVIAMPVARNVQISTTTLTNRTKLNVTTGAVPAKVREQPTVPATKLAAVRVHNVTMAGPSKPVESKPASSGVNNTSAAGHSFAVNRDKTVQRLQAYKQKTGGSTTDEANKLKRHAAIKGVRSNRRFDLQMQFREREANGTGE